MTLKIGINGLGRIGRAIYRDVLKRNDIEVALINCSRSAAEVSYHLKYDSVHGYIGRAINYGDNFIECGNNKTFLTSARDPKLIRWSDYGVDVVMECTGAFKDVAVNVLHLQDGGARFVIIAAPSPDADTVIYGVNHEEMINVRSSVVSASSCTTNCLAPVVKIVDDCFGIVKGSVTTVHSYTRDQSLLDASHKDLRRSRAAALSVIPTSTGAAKNIGVVFPHLKNKLEAYALRVPTPDVSLIDCCFVLSCNSSTEELHCLIKERSEGSDVIGCSNDQRVSIDFTGDTHSVVVDLSLTKIIDDNLCKLVGWYDNEAAFARRMSDIAVYANKVIKF